MAATAATAVAVRGEGDGDGDGSEAEWRSGGDLGSLHRMILLESVYWRELVTRYTRILQVINLCTFSTFEDGEARYSYSGPSPQTGTLICEL